jgi:hypothetical protein
MMKPNPSFLILSPYYIYWRSDSYSFYSISFDLSFEISSEIYLSRFFEDFVVEPSLGRAYDPESTSSRSSLAPSHNQC